MFKTVLLPLIALAVLWGCSEEDAENAERRAIELEAENRRLTQQIEKTNAFLGELKRTGGVIFKQQVIAKAAKFTDISDTLQVVRDRKKLKCGGNADLPGFGFLDPDSSEFVGFDIDICRAIGAAVLGSEGADLIEIMPLTSKQRFNALQTGEIDVLSRNTTWTMSRDSELRTDFAGVTFYDGQGVMVHSEGEILKLSDLQGKSICVQEGSTSQENITDYFSNLGYSVEVRAFEDRIAALRQYEETACDAYTGDKSSLMAQRTLLKKPKQHRILLESLSREPLGPVVRHNDDDWKDIVFWTLQCLLNAEALGITQENVLTMQSSGNRHSKLLLGVDAKLGEKLGLANDFCFQVIKQVGSYKDIYERHLGSKSQFNLVRGLNALYTQGGLQYPLPFK